MTSDQQFFLGLAFAIPLSILANLFTPKIQDWLSRRFKAAVARKEVVRAKQQARIDEFVKNPIRYHSYMLNILIITTMLGAGVGVFVGLLFVMGTFTHDRIGTILGQALSIFAGVLITKLCVDAIEISIKVTQAQKDSDFDG